MKFNYDLRRQPPTFDFVTFLALCEQERVISHKDSFSVTINPEVNHFQRLANHDWEWRITHLLMPLAMMMPNCSGVGIGGEGVSLGYNIKTLQKEIYFNEDFGHITAGKMALDSVKSYDHVVTIRECSYQSQRNSGDGWDIFRKYDKTLIIPDTETMFTLQNVNIELRMATYQKAGMNWFIPNGPLGLCVFNPTIPYRCFKIVNENYKQTSEMFVKRVYGIKRDMSPKIATKDQKYIWKEDTVENILEEMR
ncbi:hypothetical protein HN803_03980 [candidate division WWE3 bacterium]|jgi:hypothetical protein|nr:hypothetical protein [candidate division WWE3 bacterium]